MEAILIDLTDAARAQAGYDLGWKVRVSPRVWEHCLGSDSSVSGETRLRDFFDFLRSGLRDAPASTHPLLGNMNLAVAVYHRKDADGVAERPIAGICMVSFVGADLEGNPCILFLAVEEVTGP